MGVDIGGGTDWVELKSGDRITVCMEDEEYNGKWTLDGEEITITQAGDTFMGTLSDGVLVVDFSDLICTYVMDGVVVNEPAVEELSIDYGWWEGDWYGWWIMNNTAGEYVDLEDNCWDACARIELDSNGVGTIHLWDTDDEPGKYFSISDIEIVSGSGDMGCMVSIEGDIYDYQIGYSDWYVDPVASYTSCYDNFIAIEGYYESPSNSSDHFEYFIFLRPWGTEWEDVRNDMENPDMPYTDMMPVGYDDWYMSNIYGPMPDSFN